MHRFRQLGAAQLILIILAAGVAPGESVTLPVWVLDGYDAFAPLVKFSLTSSLSRTVVVLCASFSKPGSILPSLNKWANLIDCQIRSIFPSAAISEARQARKLVLIFSQ